MLRQTLSILSILLISYSSFASPLTPDEALSRVFATDTRSPKDAILTETLISQDGEAALYIFTPQTDKGFLIVSADDAIIPLLGYSDDNTFDKNNISPELNYWLDEYTRQIQYARENEFKPLATRGTIQLPDWNKIEPLIKTKWNQNSPYNQQCPAIGSTRAYTGCVATAMAQVMKYHNFPARGSGSISYTFNSKTYSMDFSKVTFEWDKMLDSYNGSFTPAQATAVSTLMKAAGYSVEMQYGIDGSGAYSGYIPRALTTYFGYDQSIRFYDRTWFTYSEWAKMVYDNLSLKQPVLYGGNGTGGAHQFIIDGYLDGYFHVNWGWGGSSDGYFILDALDPYGLGIGAGEGGYNFRQDMVVNIKPAEAGSQGIPQKLIYAVGYIQAETSLNNLKIYLTHSSNPGIYYQGVGDASFNIGVKIEETNNSSSVPKYINIFDANFTSKDTGFGYLLNGEESNFLDVNLASASISTNKQYKITLVYKLKDSVEWDEIPVDQGLPNYIYLTKENNGADTTYKIDIEEVKLFTASDMKLDSDLYFGLPIQFSGIISNDTDQELSRSVTFVLLTLEDDVLNLAFMGDSFVYSIAPGESFENEWTSVLTQWDEDAIYNQNTEFLWGLIDYESGYLYYLNETPITLKENPGLIYSGKIYIDGASMQGNSYIVEDAANFKVTTEITVAKGFYFNMARLYIFEPIPGTNQAQVVSTVDYPLIQINEGETGKLTVDVNFSSAVVGSQYYIDTGIFVDNDWDLIENPLVTNFIVKGNSNSAVGSVISESSGIVFQYNQFTGILSVTGTESGLSSVEVYSINGTQLVSRTVNGDYIEIDLKGNPKGIVMVTAFDRQGNRKSTKIAL